VKVTVLAGTQSIVIDQTILSGGFSTFFALSSGFQPVFTTNCAELGATISQSNGAVTVTWSAGTGGTFYISVKYDTTSLVGANKPTGQNTYVDFQFQTNGVPGSTEGLRLSKKK
jgi:hypothetical protein